MTALAIGLGLGAVTGAYLRWGVQPVLIAFELGRVVEKIRLRRQAP